MDYKKIFDPQRTQVFAPDGPSGAFTGDRADHSAYVYTEQTVLAVNVALATGRPLLVRGPSGCGKSSLAGNVAKVLGRRYYEKVISSRTQARDLLWEVDLLRRLQDAQLKQLAADFTPYVVPGILWWAFDPVSAAAHAGGSGQPAGSPGPTGGSAVDLGAQSGAVVLLDEIDKADPDVPNNLLVPLGSLTFTVDETGTVVRAQAPPLVFLTTNDERELPPAFLRRCVELRLSYPNAETLVEIGRARFGSEHTPLLERIASLVSGPATGDRDSGVSTAEYLDSVRACLALEVDAETDFWDELSRVTVWKHGRAPRG